MPYAVLMPFYLGPGVAFKALGGRNFSFIVFGLSQVAMEIEPLVRVFRGESIAHGFTGTYVGATLIGIVSVLVGKPLGEYSLRWWKEVLALKEIPSEISWPAALLGAMVGVNSHVFLESIMDAHMHPLAPFSDVNPLLGLISAVKLVLLCLGLGVFGVVSLLVTALRRKVQL